MGRRRETFEFYWDEAAATYRGPDGRFASQLDLEDALEDLITDSSFAMSGFVEDLASGAITLDEWQVAMAEELRTINTISLSLGRGGWGRVTQSDWGRLGANMREQYRFLNDFAFQLGSGEISLAQAQHRATMYANQGWQHYWNGSTSAKKAAGFTQERRVLGSAEHCDDCIGYAAQGWVPIDTLPPPGKDSQCRANCRCSKQYR